MKTLLTLSLLSSLLCQNLFAAGVVPLRDFGDILEQPLGTSVIEHNQPLTLGTPVPTPEEVRAAQLNDGNRYAAIVYSLSTGAIYTENVLDNNLRPIANALNTCNTAHNNDCILAISGGGPSVCIALAGDPRFNFGVASVAGDRFKHRDALQRDAESQAQRECELSGNVPHGACHSVRSECTTQMHL